MKRWMFCWSLISLFFWSERPGFAESQRAQLVGNWLFYKVIYQGAERPPFNPDLIITFDFHPDGTDRLFWTRRGEHFYCERFGTYDYDGQWLTDEITWVNPKNGPGCNSDPDMQQGRRTSTRLELKQGELFLYFPVGDDLLIYVWKKLEGGER